MTDNKFILESKTIWGNILSILVAFGSLGYINFTQAQADAWMIIIVGVLTLGCNLLSIYGRFTADKMLTMKAREGKDDKPI